MLSSTTPSPETTHPPSINSKVLGAAFGLLVLLYLGSYFIGGELAQIALAGLESLPFTILAVLAYIGIDRLWGKVLALGWLFLILALVGLNGLATSFLGLVEGSTTSLVPGSLPQLVDGALGQLATIVILSVVAVLLGCLGFIPAVRQWISRVLPIDPNSFVHTIALVTTVTITLLCFIPLLVLATPPTLLAVAKLTAEGTDITNGRDDTGQLLSRVYALSWTIPGTVLAVGFAVRRNFGQALQRLGFVRPTFKQVLIGIGSAVALVIAAIALEQAIGWIWQAFGWAQTDTKTFGELLAFALNPVGAVVIGVTAGLGEELGVRGVLQPRLGMLLSNLLFVSLHALQYNWDGLLAVFLLGFVFGILRNRTNTTTSAISHGVYDFLAIMLTVLTSSSS